MDNLWEKLISPMGFESASTAKATATATATATTTVP